MSLFNKLKKNTREKEVQLSYEQFAKWLDGFMDHGFEEVVALNFNLYEDGDAKWSVELVGTASFDEDDDDWACDEVFSNRETPLVWEENADWETILSKVQEFIRRYLEHGEYSDIMKENQAVAVGFVDGDLEIVYRGK